MPDRICFVHIGPHKTGSSSLQLFLRENENALLKHGVVYPRFLDDKGRPTNEHSALIEGRRSRKADRLELDDPNWVRFSEHLVSGEADILLSSENFARYFAEEDRLARFSQFVTRRGYRLVAIAYVRDQAPWINSFYVQYAKRFMGPLSFEEFLAQQIEKRRFDPFNFAGRILAQPEIELRAVSFERAIADGFYQSFLAAIGVTDAGDFVTTTAANPNAGAKSVYAARKIYRKSNTDIRQLPFYSKITVSFRNMFNKRGWTTPSYSGFDEALYQHVRDFHAESNQEFSRRFFGQDWNDVCPPRPMRKLVFDPAAVPAEEAEEVRMVIRKFVKKIERLSARQDDPDQKRPGDEKSVEPRRRRGGG